MYESSANQFTHHESTLSLIEDTRHTAAPFYLVFNDHNASQPAIVGGDYRASRHELFKKCAHHMRQQQQQ